MFPFKKGEGNVPKYPLIFQVSHLAKLFGSYQELTGFSAEAQELTDGCTLGPRFRQAKVTSVNSRLLLLTPVYSPISTS